MSEKQLEGSVETLPVNEIVPKNKQFYPCELNIEFLEKKADQINKIKNVALKVTKKSDWIDQNGTPYLTEKGCDRLMGLFGISWELLSLPAIEYEKDGHFMYTCIGKFSMGVISCDSIGAISSKNPFYSRYKDKKTNESKEKPPSQIDKPRIMKHCISNCMMNGITRVLGIKGLTWEDLGTADIQQKDVQSVAYKKGTSTDGKITDGQLKYIKTLMGKLKIEREQAIAYCCEIAKRDIKSATDLTKYEAIKVISLFKEELEIKEGKEPVNDS